MNFDSPTAARQDDASQLRALCVARHCFLSEHIARYFAELGVSTSNAVGLDAAADLAREVSPDIVICDYDVLATLPLEMWEHDVLLSNTPVIAVSLTRHAEELQLFDVNGIAGFLYLPTLDKEPALKILRAAATRPKYTLRARACAPRIAEHS